MKLKTRLAVTSVFSLFMSTAICLVLALSALSASLEKQARLQIEAVDGRIHNEVDRRIKQLSSLGLANVPTYRAAYQASFIDTLKQIADETGFSIYVWSLDGRLILAQQHNNSKEQFDLARDKDKLIRMPKTDIVDVQEWRWQILIQHNKDKTTIVLESFALEVLVWQIPVLILVLGLIFLLNLRSARYLQDTLARLSQWKLSGFKQLMPLAEASNDEISLIRREINSLAQSRKMVEDDLKALNSSLEHRIQVGVSQLMEAQQMAQLGSLVAGLSHEINTPLGIGLVLSGHFRQQLQDIKKGYDEQTLGSAAFKNKLEELLAGVQAMEFNLERATGLMLSFKQVAVDQSSYELCTVDLSEYLQHIVNSISPRLKEKEVEVKLDCPSPFDLVSFPGALAQVISNLIENSIKHGFKNRQSGTISIQVKENQEDRSTFLIDFRNDGEAILPELAKRIFEPFFTTMRGQGGSGLGLAMVKKLVKDVLQGSIELDLAVDHGARFVLKLARHVPQQSSH